MTEAPAFFLDFLLFLIQILTLKEFVNLCKTKTYFQEAGICGTRIQSLDPKLNVHAAISIFPSTVKCLQQRRYKRARKMICIQHRNSSRTRAVKFEINM